MLTWDEEVKPTSPTSQANGLIGRAMDIPPLATPAPALRTLHDGATVSATALDAAPLASAAAVSARLVNAADKREALQSLWQNWDDAAMSFYFVHYQKYDGEGVVLH